MLTNTEQNKTNASLDWDILSLSESSDGILDLFRSQQHSPEPILSLMAGNFNLFLSSAPREQHLTCIPINTDTETFELWVPKIMGP